MQHFEEHVHRQRPEIRTDGGGTVAARTYTVRVPARVTVGIDGAVMRVDFDRDELVDRIALTTEVTDVRGTRTDPNDATRQADQAVIDAYLAAHVQTVWPAEH